MLCSSLSFSRDFVKLTAICSTIASGPKSRMYSRSSENFPSCAQVVVIVAIPFLSAASTDWVDLTLRQWEVTFMHLCNQLSQTLIFILGSLIKAGCGNF